METISNVNESTESALQQAALIRQRLGMLRDSPDPAMRECYADIHDLVCDLAVIRNATHRLEREQRASG